MKYRINKGFVFQEINKKTVIFDNEESALFTFNKTATEIFKKIKKGFDDREIIAYLLKQYPLKNGKVQKDFKEIILYLKKNKIISSQAKQEKKEKGKGLEK